jgi:hypothetical protein
MDIPDWYVVALLGLAAWRTWCLLALDTILDRPRLWVAEKGSEVGDFIECPYCLGFWVALAWWGAWQAWDHGTTVVASAVAVAALVPLIQRLASDE